MYQTVCAFFFFFFVEHIKTVISNPLSHHAVRTVPASSAKGRENLKAVTVHFSDPCKDHFSAEHRKHTVNIY